MSGGNAYIAASEHCSPERAHSAEGADRCLAGCVLHDIATGDAFRCPRRGKPARHRVPVD